MKYIMIFENVTAANTWWSGNRITPNVILITGSGSYSGIHYNFQGIEW